MNPLVSVLLKKRLVYPTIDAAAGNSKTLARQLDVALMNVGFKLSGNLLRYVGVIEFPRAIEAAHTMLTSVKDLVGDHVRHNVYFIDFPNRVPDTTVFWAGLLAKHYEEGGSYTNNLLDFGAYGSYQHTYEEMLERHDTFKGKTKLKVINLGQDIETELRGLYVSLAGSNTPLNDDDRKLIATLYQDGYSFDVKAAIRENKAIINALRMSAGLSLDIDTPTDVLRLASYLSGGDVTLLENTRFKSFRRPIRRALLTAFNDLLCANPDKIEDISQYKERFKRLAKMLHPGSHRTTLPYAARAFDFAGGALKIDTWGNRLHTAIDGGHIVRALNLLSEKPGYLVRSLDKLTRESNEAEFTRILSTLNDCIARVSGRVLLSVAEHLDNRALKSLARIFVNRAGKAWVTTDVLGSMPAKRIKALSSVIWAEIERRIPAKDVLMINDDIGSVAIPLSDKTKSEGFRVLPRGSVLNLDTKLNVLRFFVYWHQTYERTDYDLSAVMLDSDFGLVGQLSWACLRDVGGYHSGDITSAPNGASEFIDIDLRKIPAKVAYILPSINAYSGESFAECKEAFMGYMMRNAAGGGAPFEAKTVQTKFALRGEQNGVCVPMAFVRTADGWQVKWMDLYSKGQSWGNRIETNRLTTALLAKTVIDRQYLTIGRLADLYRAKAHKVMKSGKLPDGGTYIGMDRPDGLNPKTEVYTLENLKGLIPA